MINLKKMLALSLTATSLISTTAFATFKDQSEITLTEAVDTLVALDIIKGYEDGTFRPETVVTRAEMAKMIYVIKNSGNDDADMFKGISTTFEDVNGHWAEGYIKYCASQEIVAGKNEKTYAPDEKITGVEALKMALVALGYKADISELVGTNWEMNTLVLATKNGLAYGFDGVLAEGAKRENAAQILYNSLYTETVKYVTTYEDYVGSGKLLAEEAMSLVTISNVYIKESTKSEGLTYSNDADLSTSADMIKTDVDYTDYIGQKVDILTDSKKGEVYGVRTLSTNVVIETEAKNVTVAGTSGNKTASFNGKNIKITDENAELLVNATENASVRIVNNGTNVFVEAKEVVTGKVIYVNADKVHVQATGYNTGELTFADDEISEDIKVDDFVQVSEDKFTGNQKVEILEIKTGVVEAKRDNEFRINGYWVTVFSGETNPELLTEVSYYQIGSVLYEVSAEVVASKDHLYVLEAVAKTNAFDTNKARVVLVDGTEVVVETANDESENAGKIVSFTKSNDVYTFGEVHEDHTKQEVKGNVFEERFTMLAGQIVADDAVVYVKHEDDKFSVLTGEEVKLWSNVEVLATEENATIYTAKTSGIDYVSIAFIDLADAKLPNEVATSAYGYVVETPYQIKEGDTNYTLVTVFTGEETLEIKVETMLDGVTKGSYVEFELLVDEAYAKTMVEIEGLELDRVKAYDQSRGYVWLEGQTQETSDDVIVNLTEETQIVYINSEDMTGVEGGALQNATDKDGDGITENNVRVLLDGKDIVLIFVDILNDMK